MESLQQPSDAEQHFTMSWTAYVRPVVIFLIVIVVGVIFNHYNDWRGALIILFGLGLFTIQVLTVRSTALYTDAEGIWVYRGIFPWSKGSFGIKWRDVEDATFFQNFFSWLFKSYTVRVGHRFTKTSEIVLPHIKRGHEAAMHINDLHHAFVGESTKDVA